MKLKKTETVIDEWSQLSLGWGNMGRVKASREILLLPFPAHQTPGESVR